MSANSPDRSLDPQLSELEACRYLFGKQQAARVVQLLAPLDAKQFPDPPSLIRFHETLLFLRAFPQGPAVVRATGRVLKNFHTKVRKLSEAGADMADLD